jgi:hypothetical protein
VGDNTLLALTKLPKLRRVYVSDTAVTAEAVAAFRNQRPSIVVYRAMRLEPREPLIGSTKARGAYTE